MTIKSWEGSRIRTAILALTLGLVQLAGGLSEAADPIKVGFVSDYSGHARGDTVAALRGWRMAVEDFNSRGGLNGRLIETVAGDDQFRPEKAVAVAKKLILEDRVDFLAGTGSSDCALAVSKVAKEFRKLFIIHQAKTARVTGQEGHRYVFRACFDTDIEGKSGGKYAARKKYNKWYLIGEDYEFGQSIMKSFWESLKYWNPSVEKVGEAWPKLKTEDYRPFLKEIMEEKPSAVFGAFGASGRIRFAKQAKAAGLFDVTHVFMPQMADVSVAVALKDDIPSNRAFGSAAYFWYHPKTEQNDLFLTRYLAMSRKDGETDPMPPSFAAFQGYCCAAFLTEALVKARSTDSDKVINAMEGLTIATPAGPIRMRACDHQATAPVFWGTLRKAEGFAYPIVEPVHAVEAEEVMVSCESVLKAREALPTSNYSGELPEKSGGK